MNNYKTFDELGMQIHGVIEANRTLVNAIGHDCMNVNESYVDRILAFDELDMCFNVLIDDSLPNQAHETEVLCNIANAIRRPFGNNWMSGSEQDKRVAELIWKWAKHNISEDKRKRFPELMPDCKYFALFA